MWTRVLFVPFTVTSYVLGTVDCDAEIVTDAYAFPPGERLRSVELKEVVRPTGTPIEDKVTFPTNPLTLTKVIVEVAEEPCGKVTLRGLASIVKSRPTVSRKTVEFVAELLAPVKVRL